MIHLSKGGARASALALLGAAALSLGACATRSSNIEAAYVSPLAYASYSCEQIHQEASRLSSRAVQASGAQDSKATGDAVATGVALVLFWPALFLIDGDGATAHEVARLKGEMEAVQQANIQKGCGIQFRGAGAPAAAAPQAYAPAAAPAYAQPAQTRRAAPRNYEEAQQRYLSQARRPAYAPTREDCNVHGCGAE